MSQDVVVVAEVEKSSKSIDAGVPEVSTSHPVTEGKEPITEESENSGLKVTKSDEDKLSVVVENKTDKNIICNGNSSVFPPPSSVNPISPVPKFLLVVEGIDKLRRAIGKELVSENSNEKCSNLPHLLSIVQCILIPSSTNTKILQNSPGSTSGDMSTGIIPPSAVLKPFTYVNKKSKKTIRFIVDIVSPDGDEWSKVSARNPKSLALLASGGGGYGQKSILDHAKDYIQCASQNQCFFKPPRVKFIFTSGIGATLCGKLEALGIKVEGERIEDADLGIHPRLKTYRELLYESDSNSEEGNVNNNQSGEDSVDGTNINGNGCGGSESGDECLKTKPKPSASCVSLIRNPSLQGILKLNLDITALLAYVSNITNGHTNVTFRSKILTQQLEFERMRPQKPVLEAVFRGRELYCCQTTYNEFKAILETVGGLQERRRAYDFLKRIKVVPDKISERSRCLEVVGNIKLRSVTIFGTGDSIQAVTVTANSGFVRSAKTQGIEYPVFLHESRALTEEKENFNSLFSYM